MRALKKSVQLGGDKRNSGMTSIAVFMILVCALLIVGSTIYFTSAVAGSSDALNTVRSQLVEKNGIAQVVRESILAIRATAPTPSGNSISTEINNRLSALNFADGISINLASADTPATHLFFPDTTSPLATTIPMFASSGTQLAGVGNTAISFLSLGPVGDLGEFFYNFNRQNSNAPAENRTYVVAAHLFSVPVTNVDCIAYGLPASGNAPAAAPAVGADYFGTDVSRLVVTSNNPTNDSTAYPDLFTPSSPEVLPSQYKNAVRFSWDAFEYIWGNPYQNSLLAASGISATYDFTAASNPTIAGISGVNTTVTVDAAQVAASVISVVDAIGGGTVVISGSPSSAAPFLLFVKNTGTSRTTIQINSNNNRPILVLARNCSVNFSGSAQFQGGIIVDRNSIVTGNGAIIGHLSFYALASPLNSFNVSLNDSPTVRAALAPIAPRVLFVTTKASR